MNNTINVNGMTGYYNSFINSVMKQKTEVSGNNGEQNLVAGSRDSFVSTLGSKVETAAMNGAEAAEESKAVSTKNMSLEQYKQYINEKISNIPVHLSKMCDGRAFSISEAGFKAMQNDPEYEKWVLDKISDTISTPFPGNSRMLTGTIYGVTSFGATKNEFRSYSWSEGYQNGNGKKIWEEKSEGSFWTHRGERKRVQEQADKKAAAKRLLEKKWQQETIEKKQAYTDFLNGKAMLKTNSVYEFIDMFSLPIDTKMSGMLTAYEAGLNT